METRAFKVDDDSPYGLFTGVGGIGAGLFFALEGDHTLGRNESRPGRLLDVHDYCKLHIIAHYFTVLTGAKDSGNRMRVLPIGKVGDDDAGRRLKAEMAAAGMDTRFVDIVSGMPTLLSVCFQYKDGSGGNITTSEAASSALTEADIDRAEPFFAGNLGRAIALAAPEVPLEARHYLLEAATAYKAFRAAAFTTAEIPAALEMGTLSLTDLVAVNEDEAAAIARKEFDPAHVDEFLDAVASALLARNPSMKILLTAGKAGAYAYSDGAWSYCPAAKVAVANTAGAGDALFGTVLAGLAAGWPLIVDGPRREAITDRPLESALDFAVLLAGYTVTSPHTIHPHANVENVVAFARKIGISFAPQLEASWS